MMTARRRRATSMTSMFLISVQHSHELLLGPGKCWVQSWEAVCMSSADVKVQAHSFCLAENEAWLTFVIEYTTVRICWSFWSWSHLGKRSSYVRGLMKRWGGGGSAWVHDGTEGWRPASQTVRGGSLIPFFTFGRNYRD